jgi:hypothetical protein
MRSQHVFKKNPKVVVRKIGNETLLIPLFKSTAIRSYIYSLNDDSGFLWNLIDGKRNLEKIKSKINDRYLLDSAGIKKLEACIDDLIKIKAIF